MPVRFALPVSANPKPQEDATFMSSWSMRERIEHVASQFLSDNRERILGPEPFSAMPCQETIRRQLLLGAFKQLADIYGTKVQALSRVKERIDHLRRSARGLKKYKSKGLARFSMDRKLEDVLRELKSKEAEEQRMLEDVFDVAKEIVLLGRTS